MKKNRVSPITMVLLLSILLAACTLPTTPVPLSAEPTAEPVPVADTTPPQVVMTELPYIAFYNLGACTPPPMVWKGQITDIEGAIFSTDVLFRFASEDGFRLSSEFRYPLTADDSGEYALSVQNSELNHVVAIEMFGTGKGIFEYQVVATDQAGNKQYYPSQSGWAELALLPCLKNEDIANANGDVSASTSSEGSIGGLNDNTAASNGNSGGSTNGSSDFCATNPSDPSCAPVTDPCLTNPLSCITVPNCEENPTDPNCMNIDPCDVNPSDPSCTVTIDPCVVNPADPSCTVTIVDPCDANPSDPSCTVTISP
ncbi:MAG: hypothetical protein GY755_07025 [Chloroflexi bacterium]|nr:hypothetical protein [Chloroflexota bacterium]